MGLRIIAILMGTIGLANPLSARYPSEPYLVKDINPRSCPSGGVPFVSCHSSPQELTDVGGTLFFSAFDPASGRELWKSDGTDSGTVRVADINPGPASSDPTQLLQANKTLFFVAHDASGELQLWKSDGTQEGTVRVADKAPIPRGLTAPKLKALQDAVFLTDFLLLWKTDGTPEGTAQLADFRGHNVPDVWDWGLTVVGTNVFFTLCDRGRDCQLWKTDGTPAGTVSVASITPPYYDSSVWGEDPAYQPGAALFALTNVNGVLFLAACQVQNVCDLWRSDGTAEGTVRVGQFVPSDLDDTDNWTYPELGHLRGTVFFPACEPATGCELWSVAHGTSGLHLIADMNPGAGISFDSPLRPGFVNVNDVLLFHIHVDDVPELWRSDGTKAGTYRISSPAGQYAKNVAGSVFFVRRNLRGAFELCKSDGTSSGTHRIGDANASWMPTLNPEITVASHRVFLVAGDAPHGVELWALPGDSEETSPCSDDPDTADEQQPTTTTFRPTTTTSTTTATTTTSTPVSPSTSRSTSTTRSTTTITSTSLRASPTTTLRPTTSDCAPSPLIKRLRAELEHHPGCDEKGTRGRRRVERRIIAVRFILAREIRSGRISSTCAEQLLALLPSCS